MRSYQVCGGHLGVVGAIRLYLFWVGSDSVLKPPAIGAYGPSGRLHWGHRIETAPPPPTPMSLLLLLSWSNFNAGRNFKHK